MPTPTPVFPLQNIQPYVSLVKDIVTGLAALIAAVVAIVGLQAWRKQLKGKTEYELAQRLLKSLYEVREAISLVRHPMISESEQRQAFKTVNLESNLFDPISPLADQIVYEARWMKLNEAIAKLDANILEAEVLWGQEVKEQLKPLRNCIWMLSLNTRRRLNKSRNIHTYDEKINKEIEDTMDAYSIDSEDNTFSESLLKAIHQVENFIKPHLTP